MTRSPVRVLLVEDDKIDRLAIERHFRKHKLPYLLDTTPSNQGAREKLADQSYDLVLLDYLLNDGTGMELLKELEDIPAIVITGAGSEEVAIEAMRAGAYDYLIKDPDGNFLTVLPLTIANVLERKRSEEALITGEARYKAFSQFANSVLHNVSNVLNSIGASCELVSRKLMASKLDRLDQLHELLLEHQDEPFLTEHPKGQQLAPFTSALARKLREERDASKAEMDHVLKNLQLIREIIETQQTQGNSGTTSSCMIAEVTRDALKVNTEQIDRDDVTVRVKHEGDIRIRCHRATLTHVLINLIKNALEAMRDNTQPRCLIVNGGFNEAGLPFLEFTDNGDGIAGENLEQVLQHGFTTKQEGHGYGLFFCANAMRDMGGEIVVTSPGKGLGSTFKLTLPPAAEDN